MQESNNPLLIVGRDSNYIKDLLMAEGIYSDLAVPISSEISNYKLAVIGDVDFNNDEKESLKEFSENGGKLVVINPNQKIASYLGLKKSSSKSAASIKIGKFLCEVQDAAFYGSKSALYKDAGGKTLIFSLDNGNVAVIGFDFLKSIYALTHSGRIGYDKDGVMRADFMTMVDEKHKLHPQADILARCLANLIEDNIAIPKNWHLPYRKKAGIIFTHDTDNVGNDELRKISRIDKENNVKATTFVLLKTGTPKCWKELNNSGDDMQLHQAYLYFPNCGKIGTAGNKIVFDSILFRFQSLLLYCQKLLLSISLGKTVQGSRNHGLVAFKGDKMFRWMKNSGLRFDGTLGSAIRYGYLYGSGLPYVLRLQNDYESTGIVEFPLHFMDYVAYRMGYNHNNKKDCSRLFAMVKKLAHELIDKGIEFGSILSFDFHHKFLMHKEIMELYLDTIVYSKKNGLLMSSMSYFYDFWTKKSQVSIGNIEYGESLIRYEVKSRHKIEGFTQLVPAKFMGKKIAAVKINGEKAAFETIKKNNRSYAIFEWNLGDRDNVEAAYG